MTLKFITYQPRSGGRPQQIVVLLHGVNNNSRGMKRLAASLVPALPEALFVLPDALQLYDGDGDGTGLQWFSMGEWFKTDRKDTALLLPGLRRAASAVNAFIDELLEDTGLPASKLVLGGFSQGAMTALYTGLRRPEPIGGIMAWSGRFADDGTVLQRVPTLVVHGGQDSAVPAENYDLTVRALRAKGVPVTGTLYPALGHEIGDAQRAEGKAFLKNLFAPPAALRPSAPGLV